ncbi:hypothetical protein [Aromatoleum evansii]|nr:hypothetical protein [Aromatoleum evansii]
MSGDLYYDERDYEIGGAFYEGDLVDEEWETPNRGCFDDDREEEF